MTECLSRGDNLHGMFRTGDRVYDRRPPANCVSARLAWDHASKSGPIVSLHLLDGYWGAERPDGRTDEYENTFRRLAEQRAGQP